MCIVLFGVMAVFWSAFTIEAASRSKHTVLKFQDTGDAGIDAVQQSLNQLTSGPSDPPDQSVLDAIAPLFTRAAFFPYPTGDPRRQLYVICRVRIILEDIVPLIKDKDKSERVQEAIKLLGGMQVDVSQAFPGFDVTGNIHDHVGNEDAFLDAFNNTKVVVWDKTEFFNRLDRLVKVLSPITKIPADFADR
jgi:hypothetical protein